MPLFENLNLRERLNFQENRNTYASIAAGTLFFLGWWLIIDIAARYPDMSQFHHAYHVCGVVGTLSLFMINSVNNGQIRGDSYTEGCLGQRGARAWLFLGLVMGFTALIASCWILFQSYVIPQQELQWPGVGLFLQNLFIFLGSLIYRFGRTEESW